MNSQVACMDEDVTDITLKGTFISLFIAHFSLQMHKFLVTYHCLYTYVYFLICVDQQNDNIELIIPDFLDKPESLVCDESIFTFATKKKKSTDIVDNSTWPPIEVNIQ